MYNISKHLGDGFDYEDLQLDNDNIFMYNEPHEESIEFQRWGELKRMLIMEYLNE